MLGSQNLFPVASLSIDLLCTNIRSGIVIRFYCVRIFIHIFKRLTYDSKLLRFGFGGATVASHSEVVIQKDSIISRSTVHSIMIAPPYTTIIRKALHRSRSPTQHHYSTAYHHSCSINCLNIAFSWHTRRCRNNQYAYPVAKTFVPTSVPVFRSSHSTSHFAGSFQPSHSRLSLF